jgi:hypothetical protein
MFDARLYPADWKKRRREKLAAAGYRCEECGVAHKSIQQNTRSGEDYMVYLSIAHKEQYQTWARDAETMVLCQRCHRRYDRQFRRRAGTTRTYTPISYVTVFVQQDGREVPVGDAKTYDDLRDMVAALPEYTAFSIHMMMHQAIVGNGLYQKLGHGGRVEVHGEYGACVGLSTQLPPLSAFRARRFPEGKEGR